MRLFAFLLLLLPLSAFAQQMGSKDCDSGDTIQTAEAWEAQLRSAELTEFAEVDFETHYLVGEPHCVYSGGWMIGEHGETAGALDRTHGWGPDGICGHRQACRVVCYWTLKERE